MCVCDVPHNFEHIFLAESVETKHARIDRIQSNYSQIKIGSIRTKRSTHELKKSNTSIFLTDSFQINTLELN